MLNLVRGASESSLQTALLAFSGSGAAGGSTSRIRSLLPRTHPAGFNDLSADDIGNIAGFLTVRELTKLQSTCKKALEGSDTPEVWQRLLHRDFTSYARRSMQRIQQREQSFLMKTMKTATRMLNRGGAREVIDFSAKEAYRDKYAEYTTARERVRRDQTEILIQGSARKRGMVLRSCLDVVHYPIGMGAPCCMFALWLLLLMLKLNGNLDITFHHVWIPIWVFVLVSLVSLCLGSITKVIGRSARRNSMWYNQHEGDEHSLFGCVNFLREHSSNRKLGRCIRISWLAIILTLLFVGFPALVLAKLEGLTTAAWGVVFLPVFIVCAMWCAFPCMLKRAVTAAVNDSDTVMVGWVLSLLVLAPFLAVIIMVILRLKGDGFEAALTFIPLFVVEGVLLIGCCLTCCISACRGREGRTTFWPSCLVVVTVSLGIAGQVYASIYDRKHHSFPVVGFILPTVIATFIVATYMCVASCIRCKSSREESFQGAWPYVTRCGCCHEEHPSATSTLPAGSVSDGFGTFV